MINSTLKEPKQKPEFPCIGRYSEPDMYVLFTSKNIGTVIYQGDANHKIGTHKDYWLTSWKPYNGKVMLENEENMPIKVGTSNENDKITYPCLGIYPNKQIVLFTSRQYGTLVAQGTETTLPIGTCGEHWVPDWKLYTGVVTLEND